MYIHIIEKLYVGYSITQISGWLTMTMTICASFLGTNFILLVGYILFDCEFEIFHTLIIN